MPEFRYISDEVAARNRARNTEAPLRQAPARPETRQPRQRNVESVLSLGDVRYFAFHQRTYRVPPVPFKLGQLALDAHIKVLSHAKVVALTGNEKASREFYREMARLAKLMWQHVRPLGKFRRLMWRMGLLRNPFLRASEGEMSAVADFFLQGRMTSSVRSMSEAEALS